MRTAPFAEKLLKAVIGKQRASAVVGDLVEIGRSKGIAWFWLSVGGCLARRLWQPFIGVTAVLYSTNWMFNVLQRAAIGVNTKHLPIARWEPLVLNVAALGAIMGGASFYSAVCYGFSDELTQFAMVVFGLCCAVVYGWWVPAVLPASVVVFVSVLVFFSLRAKRRWAMLTAFAVSGFSYLGWSTVLLLLQIYENSLLRGGPLRRGLTSNRELLNHPSIGWLAFVAFNCMAALVGGTCSFMHNRATRSARDFDSHHETEQALDIG